MAPGGIPVGVAEMAPELGEEEAMKEKVMDVVKKDPRRAATILKEWLSE
jgi:flagellar biosynthesis/type III secretory pathway M-ring protein FliF/YscJ